MWLLGENSNTIAHCLACNVCNAAKKCVFVVLTWHITCCLAYVASVSYVS